jgi:hypothetical protein
MWRGEKHAVISVSLSEWLGRWRFWKYLLQEDFPIILVLAQVLGPNCAMKGFDILRLCSSLVVLEKEFVKYTPRENEKFICS